MPPRRTSPSARRARSRMAPGTIPSAACSSACGSALAPKSRPPSRRGWEVPRPPPAATPRPWPPSPRSPRPSPPRSRAGHRAAGPAPPLPAAAPARPRAPRPRSPPPRAARDPHGDVALHRRTHDHGRGGEDEHHAHAAALGHPADLQIPEAPVPATGAPGCDDLPRRQGLIALNADQLGEPPRVGSGRELQLHAAHRHSGFHRHRQLRLGHDRQRGRGEPRPLSGLAPAGVSARTARRRSAGVTRLPSST